MALPTLEANLPPYDPETQDKAVSNPSNDPVDSEKDFPLDNGIIGADTQVEGVYAEGPRLVDMGEDGKERPIDSDADYAIRLVSLDDDPTLPIHTFRTWFLGLGLACFGAVLGQIFYFRPQHIDVSVLFLQIVSYILGKVLEDILPGPNPSARFRTSDHWFWRFLNPSPFNIKEHVAITIMASPAAYAAKSIDLFVAQDLYYNVRPNAATTIFTLISTQLIGYGMAGVLRSFLVFPTFAVYPQAMPTVQLFDTFHRGTSFLAQKKRFRFFWLVFIGIFIWEWFPEYIAPTLTGISIFCLADQNSAWVSRIFGGTTGNEGLGLFSICLDWVYVGSGGGTLGALFTPLSTQLSLYAGVAVCIIAFCATYASNTWHAQSFPFLSQLLFFENGTEYNQLAILNDNFELDYEKLEKVGLPWYTSAQLLYNISRTMYLGATITHFFIWHGAKVWEIISNRSECIDVHYQKMKIYKEVSNWVYLGISLVCAAVGIGTSYAAKSGLPWWAAIVALLFAWLFVPIAGTLNAVVGYTPNIGFLIQMLGSVLVPGKPVANMYFDIYGGTPLAQSYRLLQDLKIGQYTKLPPRVTFTMQMIGTIMAGLLNFVIMNTILPTHREILKDVQGTNIWSGQSAQAFNSAAITWGALGKPLYATGSRYGFVPYMLLVGLGFPIPFWIGHKLWPKFGFNYVFTPALVAELGFLSSGINSRIFMTVCLAVFSQYYLRKYCATWFRKYNFLMSAALDGGTSVMVFVYTFAVGGGSGTARPFPNWALNPKGNPDYCKQLSRRR